MAHLSSRLFPAGAITLAVLLAAPAAVAQSSGSGATAQGFSAPAPLLRFGPPEGWEFAFDDGRLNPQRGQRTARGDAQSSQLWTDTVPRRAIPLPAGTVLPMAGGAD
ncbi:MAG: hypothetical protein AAGB05_02535 [Pseudomonadota bacterium]